MRAVAIAFILVGLFMMAGVAMRGCDRSLHYGTKHDNTVSTTTPGATASLEDHASLSRQAMNDVESMALWALGGGALLLAGAIAALLARQKSP